MNTIKKNYLNNKDILLEIHKSKITFCSFTDTKYSTYDAIVASSDEIPEKIELARKAHSIRNPLKSEIKNTDLVFRVMSIDHIPINLKEEKISKLIKNKSILFDCFELTAVDDLYEMINVSLPSSKKVNFPPFIHCILDENNNIITVGKSHWKGDLDTGEFNTDHGKITENLGRMFLALTSRYATRPNWRGYTYNDEMQSSALLQLVSMGLKFNELKGSNPFAYFTQVIKRAFYLVLFSEKKAQGIRDDILEENGLNPSLTRQMMDSHTED